MPRAYYSVKHVNTLADLPEKLTVGRAYFIGDEHYIIIDHGKGPVIYGNKSGLQGIPGEPIPELQAQIDKLAEASIRQSWLLENFSEKHSLDMAVLSEKLKNTAETLNAKFTSENEIIRDELNAKSQNIRDTRLNDLSMIMEQISQLSDAIIQLSGITEITAENLRSTEAALLNLMIDYTGGGTSTVQPQSEPPASITTSDGRTWDISNVESSGDEGTLIFSLKS